MYVARLSRLVFTLLVFGALVSAVAVPAGAESPAGRTGVRAAVDVAAMDLDVVATSKKDGRDVTDLTRAEISVTVDGKPVALDYFARVEAGQLHGPDLATASPDLILQTTAAGADRFLPRQFLVFFDDEHLLPVERRSVLEGLRDFVTRLSPSDAMAILAYNVSTRVFVPFTNSKEDLLGGLGRLEKAPPRGFYWDVQYRQAIQDTRRARPASRDSFVRNWGAQAWARDKSTMDEFRRAIEALGARAGKRILILVSHGIELRPGQSLAQALGGNALNQFDYSIQDPYRAAVDAANRAGITIHSLDARGLATDVDAGESQPAAIDPFLANVNRRELLSGFAEETGGILVENRNGFVPALDQIMRESAGYYAVGVTLSSLDAKKPRHDVRVATSRPGVTVRTRRGYTPLTAADAARDHMEMSLITPDAPGDFAVSLRTEPARKGGGLGHRVVPFSVVVPISSLTFLDEGGKKKAVVEVILAAVEDKGSRSDPVTDRREIVVSPEVLAKSAGEPFVYHGEFKSRTGNIRFVASVRDVATNRIGVGSASVKVE